MPDSSLTELIERFARLEYIRQTMIIAEVDDEVTDQALMIAFAARDDAAAEFLRNAGERPRHLDGLFGRLTTAGVTDEKAANYCVYVEAIRTLSDFREIRPSLVPSKPVDDPVLNAMRGNLAELTLPSGGTRPDVPTGDIDNRQYRRETSIALGKPGDDEAVSNFLVGRLLANDLALQVDQRAGERIAALVFGHTDLARDIPM